MGDVSNMSMVVYESDFFNISQADFCSVPGYLILRCNRDVESLSQLAPEELADFGELISKSVAVIEHAVQADRVYTLSFCEVDRQLHFHLFPRTDWLKEAYQFATETDSEPVNGALLFEWSRQQYLKQADLPEDIPTVKEMVEKIRACFG